MRRQCRVRSSKWRISSAATAPLGAPVNTAHLSLAQRRVMTAIEVCRTAALGGHVERCEDCAHTRIAYNSCRNRHCPKCQWPAAQAWLEAREAELLPVPCFHVVYTLPAALGAIAYQNKAKVYGLLFTAAADTLTTVAADPKHLGADIGVSAVLHTWGIASYQVVACRWTASVGWPASAASFLQCGCFRACSDACS
jgi:Transposase zinc-binding domain